MYLVNTETVPGAEITQMLGLVQGNTIRAKNIGRDIGAGLKNLVGGELTAYTELLTEARQEATGRMVAEAQRLGANAIVNVRYTTSAVAGGAAELYAYGTAVVLSSAPGGSGQSQFAQQPQVQNHPQFQSGPAPAPTHPADDLAPPHQPPTPPVQ